MTTINPLSTVSATVNSTSNISPVGKIVIAATVVVSAFAGLGWITDAITDDVARTSTCISLANTNEAPDSCTGTSAITTDRLDNTVTATSARF